MVHGIDHVVLPVRDLAVARVRLNALGFTVAPDALHPFGTGNACVFFANRTYIEPLAVANRIEMEENARKGLVFLRRLIAYRFRCGPEGFSKLALTTEDADGDRARLDEAGYGGGPVFPFERKAIAADGAETTIGVRLAFALDERSPDMTLFCCQHIGTEGFWAPKNTTHDNGALGIAEVFAAEENPSDFQYDLEAVTGERGIHASSLGIHAELPKGAFSIVTPTAFRMIFGRDPQLSGRGPRLSAFVVNVADLDRVKALLTENGVAFEPRGSRIVVAPAPGLATVLAFQEKPAS